LEVINISETLVAKEKLQDPKNIKKYIEKAKKGKKITLKEHKEGEKYPNGLISIEPDGKKISLSFKATQTSSGTAEGEAVIVKDKNSLERIEGGKIAVLPNSTPKIVPYIVKANGLVGEERSILCHLGIVSREFEIPCFLGIRNATRLIKDNDFIKFHPEKEIVEVIR